MEWQGFLGLALLLYTFPIAQILLNFPQVSDKVHMHILYMIIYFTLYINFLKVVICIIIFIEIFSLNEFKKNAFTLNFIFTSYRISYCRGYIYAYISLNVGYTRLYFIKLCSYLKSGNFVIDFSTNPSDLQF